MNTLLLVGRIVTDVLPFVVNVLIAVVQPGRSSLSRILDDAEHRGNVKFGNRREDVESIVLLNGDIRAVIASVATAILLLYILQHQYIAAAVTKLLSDSPLRLQTTVGMIGAIFFAALCALVVELFVAWRRLLPDAMSPLEYRDRGWTVLGTNLHLRPAVLYVLIANLIAAMAALLSNVLLFA